jgi:hypothetical protein
MLTMTMVPCGTGTVIGVSFPSIDEVVKTVSCAAYLGRVRICRIRRSAS